LRLSRYKTANLLKSTVIDQNKQLSACCFSLTNLFNCMDFSATKAGKLIFRNFEINLNTPSSAYRVKCVSETVTVKKIKIKAAEMETVFEAPEGPNGATNELNFFKCSGVTWSAYRFRGKLDPSGVSWSLSGFAFEYLRVLGCYCGQSFAFVSGYSCHFAKSWKMYKLNAFQLLVTKTNV